MHARVAFYKLRSGSFEQVAAAVAAPGGLLELFRERPGFQSYELIETPVGVVSVSHGEPSTQANEATRAAAAWVAEPLDDAIKLQRSDTGEVVLSASLASAASH